MRDRDAASGLDALGRLELVGLGAALGGLGALVSAQLLGGGTAPGPTAWLVATVVGAAVCVVVVLLTACEWRRHGGRRAQRLGRLAWTFGRVPQDLRTRVAVLRDLERRERLLDRRWVPAWVPAVLWTAIVAEHLTSGPRPLEAVTWVGLWSLFAVSGVVDLVDRRTRPRLRRLIAMLRDDPVPVPSPAGSLID